MENVTITKERFSPFRESGHPAAEDIDLLTRPHGCWGAALLLLQLYSPPEK